MQENNFTHITDGIAQVIETEEKLLSSLPTEVITHRRNKQNRTIKQILGHLIDSASNNHQRMVRLQYSKDLLFFPDYRQDNDLWIALQDYQNANWTHLIQLWNTTRNDRGIFRSFAPAHKRNSRINRLSFLFFHIFATYQLTNSIHFL